MAMTNIIGANRFRTLAFNLIEGLKDPGNVGDDLAAAATDYLADAIASIDQLHTPYETRAEISGMVPAFGMPFALANKALIVADRLAGIGNLELAMGMKPILDNYAPELSDLTFVQIGLSELYPSPAGSLKDYFGDGGAKGYLGQLQSTDFKSAMLAMDILHGKSLTGDFISPLINVAGKSPSTLANQYETDMASSGKAGAFASKEEGEKTVWGAVTGFVNKVGNSIEKIAKVAEKDLHVKAEVEGKGSKEGEFEFKFKYDASWATPPATEPPKQGEEPPKQGEEPPKQGEEPPKQGEEPPKQGEEPVTGEDVPAGAGAVAMPGFEGSEGGGPTGCVSPVATTEAECRRIGGQLWSSQNYFEGGVSLAGMQTIAMQSLLTAGALAIADGADGTASVEIDLGTYFSSMANMEVALKEAKLEKDLKGVVDSLGQIPGVTIGIGK
jgi:hypothetical protein